MDVPIAPLAGLRVLELASGIAGPYAGRLLAMLGATVVKVEPDGGDPARRQWIDDEAPPVPSPLWVHLAAGKRLVAADAADVDRAVRWAHLVIDDRVRASVVGGPLDPERLDRLQEHRPLVARVTAWGFDAEEPGTIADELLVQAASGLMSATGDDGRPPLRFPGWQSQYLAGGFTAAASLAVLGEGRHEVEATWIGSALTAVESGLATFLYAASAPGRRQDRLPNEQRAMQDGAFPSGAFACADGHVIPGTVRPVDWELQCGLYGRPDLQADERFQGRSRWQHRDALRAELQPWYDARSKREIFSAALGAGWAAAMVMTAEDALADPHLAERRLFSPVTGGADATVIGRPWRTDGVPAGQPVVLEEEGASNAWFADAVGQQPPPAAPAAPAMADLRVLELTWAWAGPFVGRFLGTLGADVVRIETGGRPDGWRTRMKWSRAGVEIPEGVDPESYTWDAAALFNTVNRNKRGVSIDLASDGGVDAFRRLLAVADVLVVNMTASVLADRGIEGDVLAAVERGLVAVTLPAVGATGPYRAMAGYGTLTEGMGGFAARFGYEDEGARVSSTYYPDDIAGLHATVAVLSGLAQRSSTGTGSFIDLSQQEVTWLQMGEGIPHKVLTGREAGRMGNREPGVPGSGVEADGDGWVAVVGDRREQVLTWSEGHRSGVLEARGAVERVEHPVTGERLYLGVPGTVDGRPLATRRPAPVFDQHTDEVLADWAGMEPAEVARLRAEKAVGTRPQVRPTA
ncbi:MAG: hypothetical protein AVDCRST_MAG50-204 [uncultured Acidimicrobiales bacterium]|uniref:CAIB/BAIF family protein n=1 Tax=uncultured Acidimicrobiales bacterium TaxID=310071 RepID=A0A6J4H957_9ACTN|nr:MAG: hypothetical protein AVDCRST_MAG50-204 [uncultured Acidimicrobiales bacterium]